jgi:hypothetical protein
MIGNDSVRFCSQCHLHVYNLTELTREQAEDLILKTEGRLCARFYKRADGTLLTRDCPVGLVLLRQKCKSVLTKALGLVAACYLALIACFGSDHPIQEMQRQFRNALINFIKDNTFQGSVILPSGLFDKTD